MSGGGGGLDGSRVHRWIAEHVSGLVARFAVVVIVVGCFLSVVVALMVFLHAETGTLPALEFACQFFVRSPARFTPTVSDAVGGR